MGDSFSVNSGNLGTISMKRFEKIFYIYLQLLRFLGISSYVPFPYILLLSVRTNSLCIVSSYFFYILDNAVKARMKV